MMVAPLRILRNGWNGKLLLRGGSIIGSSGNEKGCGALPWNFTKRNINISRRWLNQDPYTVLGLSRNATTNEIKKQFRLLAKKYHPDINPSPDAKQKMASITAAYELLSDPKKKEFYDKTGMTDDMNYDGHGSSGSASNFEGAFSGFGDASFMFTDFAEMFSNMAGSKTTSTRGEDIQTEITLKFMEAIKGCEKNIRLNVKVSCNNCNGSGKKPGTNLTICKVCNGSGIQRIERGPIIIGVPCRNCSGNGQIINNPCKQCSGSGVKFQTKNITLDIPPGIKKGMQMRIPNQGHSGYRGGKNGHLFVTINIEPHKIFKWVDDNIHVEVPLTMKQCLLGGVIKVPTLNGDMDLLIRPKTYPNSERVLKGKGPCKVDSHTNGDLIVKFSLKIPDKLTPRQVELIEEFNRIELNQGRDDTDEKFNVGNSGSGGGNVGDNGAGVRTSREAGAAKGAENHVPEPPPISQKKKNNVNNWEGKNDSNVPIPPPPPKSTRQGGEAHRGEAHREMKKDTRLHNNMNTTHSNGEGNAKHTSSFDQFNMSSNNMSTNKTGNSSYKMDDTMNKANSSGVGVSPDNTINGSNQSADSYQPAGTETRGGNSSSTFSYAKKWISDKLRPKT
ncbi:DnaJ protein, putative [Plasmodium knowlesi strain H]|uniref:DnaJ protein, putative n=3 Tax=Plasmodium knowlesi TaxID=5850 RepID=A0A5K1UH24_PLAKH|nr:chaperone protein DnaJ, putative [Plasmodium knowlesi strain H]OTN68603.1 putative DNAJ protein [Plasmodium knowlesi]CAA9986503.1 chaperone protein DnaJ, putative [Plasmodium knowlesi strain H]SBO24237.1 DnaJ protein, putative [Plasmodium knowlesi strain H]SBO29750.1 DnaJ protein, putative [Plasmodium knowlesi strain H]VVS75977.1 chaperone protein DnaJ, putative [Plasmodium knowlesi strain H]|eukprot:XP_002261054.1 DNAJ protein, putative [Plasmodium knowlesi strain H]